MPSGNRFTGANSLMHTYPEHIFKDQGVVKHRAEDLGVLSSYDLKAAIIRNEINFTDYKKIAKTSIK